MGFHGSHKPIKVPYSFPDHGFLSALFRTQKGARQPVILGADPCFAAEEGPNYCLPLDRGL